jgi:gamma-glutamyltranspeptidase/glutathione hydrolase
MWADRIVREADDGWGFILRDRENEIGYQSITTPRTLAALDHALRRYGTMTLSDVIQPAIEYAEIGFLVRPTSPNTGIVHPSPAAPRTSA